MNVTLVQGVRTDREGNIFSSRGVGEASMACATCPFFSDEEFDYSRHAVPARLDLGIVPEYRPCRLSAQLDSGMDLKQAAEFVEDTPATPERVRLCCGDQYVKLAARGCQRHAQLPVYRSQL